MSGIDYVIGDQSDNRFLPDDFKDEYFLFSVYPFYNVKKRGDEYIYVPDDFNSRFQNLQESGIHKYTGHRGKIMLDSGGFQLIKKNVKLDIDDTLQIYEAADFRNDDRGITLDYCPRADEDAETRMNKIIESNENYRRMFNQDKQVLQVIHGWTRKELKTSLKPVVETADSMITFGSCFAMMTFNAALDEMISNMGGIRAALIKRFMMFQELLQESGLDEARIHVLGASSGNSSHVMWYSGMDQCDSANWRIKAAFGKIAFVGKTEVKISKRKSSFGASGWKDEYDQMLKECECPVCRHLSLKQRKELLSESFKARAIHNAHIYLEEREVARELIGTVQYKRYLQKRFKRSWFWKKFLKRIDESKHQKELDFYIKTEI